MRDGRRNRLGLQTGTDGTVEETYLDRILSDVEVAGEPNILSLDPDVNVRTTDQRYVSDAYKYYLGGGYDASQDDFPIQVEDFTGGQLIDTSGDGAQIPGAVDTLVNVNTPEQQRLIDEGIGVQLAPGQPISHPAEGMPVTQAEIDEFNRIPVSNIAPTVEQIAAMEDIGATDTIESLTEPTVEQILASEDIGATDTIESLTEPNLIDIGRDKINDIGQSISDALGTAYDKLNQTVEIAGKKINLASTAAKAILNKYIGGPISLVIDALNAMDLPGGPTLQTSKAQSIGLAALGETQDKYGINTQSMMGDYDKYNIDRVEQLESIVKDQLSRGLTNTIQMRELKDRQEYNTISGVGGDVERDQPGMTIAEDIAFQNRVDAGIEAADDDSGSEMLDIPADTVDVQAVEEMIENAKAQEAAKIAEIAEIAEIDRQNKVKEAEEAAAQRAPISVPVPSHISGGRDRGSDQAAADVAGDSWEYSPFAKGGRVRYSKGGIVDLL
jgi:hypothetical protein